MTQAKAKLTGYRQAPRKVRLIAGLVRGKSVDRALIELEHRAKRSAPIFAKLIKSAVANAKSLGLNGESLVVSEIRVDKGPMLKRSRPRAHGRAFSIHKHTSHILLTLTDTSAGKTVTKKTAVADETKQPVAKKEKPTAKPAPKKAVTKKSTAKAK